MPRRHVVLACRCDHPAHVLSVSLEYGRGLMPTVYLQPLLDTSKPFLSRLRAAFRYVFGRYVDETGCYDVVRLEHQDVVALRGLLNSYTLAHKSLQKYQG